MALDIKLNKNIRKSKYPDHVFRYIGYEAAHKLKNEDEKKKPQPIVICPNPCVNEKETLDE